MLEKQKELWETPEVEIINNVSEIVMPQLVIGNNHSAELVEQVKMLNEKVDRMESIDRAIVTQTKRSADTLQKFDEVGMKVN